MDRRFPVPGGIRAVRLASRLQLATTFTAESSASRRSAQRGMSKTGQPPALMVDVKVIIRRHFPVLVPGGNRIVEKVAEDITLRRRPSRRLRDGERVERALADEVLPAVAHPFDRGAVVAATKEICTYVAAACNNPHIAHGGAHVLVVIDTFACCVLFRPPPTPGKPALQSFVRAPENLVAATATRHMDVEVTVPTKKPNPYGVIGDRRPKPVVEKRAKVEDLKGWKPL